MNESQSYAEDMKLKMAPVKIVVTQTICPTYEELVDILSSMFTFYPEEQWCNMANAGPNCDYSKAEKEIKQKYPDADPCFEDVCAYVLLSGGKLAIRDLEGDEGTKYLTLENLKKGISAWMGDGTAKSGGKPWVTDEGIPHVGIDPRDGNFDTDDGHCLLQLSIYGDVIYG